MVTIEELGLLKMDFLGLRNLTVIADAEKLIRRHTPDFSIENVDMSDPATYEMLGKGSTMGVFQLETCGHYQCCDRSAGRSPSRILPQSLRCTAPVRCSPFRATSSASHHPEKVTYKHPLLEPIF